MGEINNKGELTIIDSSVDKKVVFLQILQMKKLVKYILKKENLKDIVISIQILQITVY